MKEVDALTTTLAGETVPTLSMVVPSLKNSFKKLHEKLQVAHSENDLFKYGILKAMTDDYQKRFDSIENPIL